MVLHFYSRICHDNRFKHFAAKLSVLSSAIGNTIKFYWLPLFTNNLRAVVDNVRETLQLLMLKGKSKSKFCSKDACKLTEHKAVTDLSQEYILNFLNYAFFYEFRLDLYFACYWGVLVWHGCHQILFAYLGTWFPMSTNRAVRSSLFSRQSSCRLLVLDDQDLDRNSAPWHVPS